MCVVSVLGCGCVCVCVIWNVIGNVEWVVAEKGIS